MPTEEDVTRDLFLFWCLSVEIALVKAIFFSFHDFSELRHACNAPEIYACHNDGER